MLCEGDTEEIAIRHFVRRQWEADSLSAVGLHPINLNGKLEDIFDYAPRYARDAQVVAVFALVDLYGMNRVKHDDLDDLDAKVARVTRWLNDGLPAGLRQCLHPHVSVHEVEAWLLAEGKCLALRLRDNSIEPDPQAEVRNFLEPPSRRLDALFKSHRQGDGYRKIKDGTPLWKCADFAIVYKMCRYFRLFYDDLKAVAQETLSK